MSIRYLKKDNTVGTVASVKHLFDPRYMDNFPADECEHPWKRMLKILNTLYCKENIEDYEFTSRFMFSGSVLSRDEWLNFVTLSEDVPADQRYIFPMLRKERELLSNSRISIPSNTLGRDLGPSFIAWDFEWERFAGLDKDTFTTKIANAHEKITSQIFEHNDIRDSSRWRVSNIFYSNQIIGFYLKFTIGQIIINNEQGLFTPYSLLEYFTTHPETYYKVTFNNPDKTVKLVVANTVTKTNRSPLYRILSYSTDALSLLPYPNMMSKEKDPVLVGVELEVCTDYDVRSIIDAAEEPFFLAKNDSSITGNKRNAMELVTAPSSFKYLKKQYAIWFNNLDYSKFDVTTQTNNGMHVHVGREHFEDNTHIRNFCWFFNNPANTDFLLYISERTRESLMRWAPIYQFPSHYTRVQAFRHVFELVGSGHRGITNFKGGWQSAKTVEVRMFRGIVSYASIVKNLEFVEAVFNFTKDLTSYRQMTLNCFLKWLDLQPNNKYILLRKFISKTSVKTFLAASEVKDIIFNERDPETIIRILEKASFKLTNEHISALNKGRKRTFILDKETKTLTLVQSNRSKLAELDKSFAERYLRDLPST